MQLHFSKYVRCYALYLFLYGHNTIFNNELINAKVEKSRNFNNETHDF